MKSEEGSQFRRKSNLFRRGRQIKSKTLKRLKDEANQCLDKFHFSMARKDQLKKIGSGSATWNDKNIDKDGKPLISSPSSDAGTSYSSASNADTPDKRSFYPSPEATSGVCNTLKNETAQIPAIAKFIPAPT